jgi:hypothetical protein
MLRSTHGTQEINNSLQEAIIMASQLGKRYKCEVCGTEILCIKAGAGPVTCCGKEVKSSEAKPIPSSD